MDILSHLSPKPSETLPCFCCETMISLTYMQDCAVFFEFDSCIRPRITPFQTLPVSDGGEVAGLPAAEIHSARPISIPDRGFGFSKAGLVRPKAGLVCPGAGLRWGRLAGVSEIAGASRGSRVSGGYRVSGGSRGASLPDNHMPRLRSRAFICSTTLGCRPAKLCCCVASRLASYS